MIKERVNIRNEKYRFAEIKYLIKVLSIRKEVEESPIIGEHQLQDKQGHIWGCNKKKKRCIKL